MISDEITVHTMDGCTPNQTDKSRYLEIELVREGCVKHQSIYSPTTSEYCYCSEDFCNNAILLSSNYSHIFFHILIVMMYYQLFS